MEGATIGARALSQISGLTYLAIQYRARQLGFVRPAHRRWQFSPEQVRAILAYEDNRERDQGGSVLSICPYRCSVKDRTHVITCGYERLHVCQDCAEYHATSSPAWARQVEQRLAARYGPPRNQEDDDEETIVLVEEAAPA